MATEGSLQAIYAKNYNVKAFYETYFDKNSSFVNDAVTTPLKRWSELIRSGAIKGDIMIQAGNSFMIHHLLTIPDHFKEVFVIDHLDKNIEEFNKWMEKSPDALDLTASKEFMYGLAGDRSSLPPLNEMEDKLRKSITKVLKCDILKANPVAPISIPQADCLFSPWHLPVVCEDVESFKVALKNLATLLKPGGHIVVLTALGATFYHAGKFKFPNLYITDEQIGPAFSEAGFTIEALEVFPRTCYSVCDSCDYSKVAFVIAHT